MKRLIIIGVLLLTTVTGASAADPITLTIPCGNDPFRTCADLKKVMVEGVTTEPKLIGFRGAVRDVLEDIYAGRMKAANLTAPANGSASSCSTLNVAKPPICPPLRVSENGCRDEFTVNFKNEACPALSQVGHITTEKYYYTLGRSSSGSRETAHIAGGLVLAVSNQAPSIEREVAANALVIPRTSPCFAQAKGLRDLIASQSDVKLLERVRVCDVTNTETCSTKKYFQASLSTIESAYLLVARCRLADEVAKKFKEFAFDFPKLIEDGVVKGCFSSSPGSPASMRACYARGYDAWIKKRARESFPIAASACGG